MERHVEQTELPLNKPRIPLVDEEAQEPAPLARATAARLLEEAEEEEELLPRRARLENAATASPADVVKAMARASEKQLAEITEKGLPATQKVVDGQSRVLTPEEINATYNALKGEFAKHGLPPFSEDPELYTNWSTREPPSITGFYDVTDSRTGTLNERWWFEMHAGPMLWRRWINGVAHVTTATLMHDEFIDRGYAWRGLRKMPQQPYPVPPYDPLLLPKEAPLAGKYVLRKVEPLS
jgi:hypothetical protein